jgi:hypothetical protein
MATHTFKLDGQEATQDATFANDQLTIGDVAYTITMDEGAELGNGHATLTPVAADGSPLVGTLAPIVPAAAPAADDSATPATLGGRRRRKSAKKASKKSSKKRRSSKKKGSSKKR